MLPARLLPHHRRSRQRSDLQGFDHTREHVPILAFGTGAPAGADRGPVILADIAETIAAKLGLPKGPHGAAWPP